MRKLFIFLSLMFFNSFVFSNTEFSRKYSEIVFPDVEHEVISRGTKLRIIELLAHYKIPKLINRATNLLEQFDNGDKACVQELVLNFETLANIIPMEDDLSELSSPLLVSLQELQENYIYFGKFLEFYYSWHEVAGLESK